MRNPAIELAESIRMDSIAKRPIEYTITYMEKTWPGARYLPNLIKANANAEHHNASYRKVG